MTTLHELLRNIESTSGRGGQSPRDEIAGSQLSERVRKFVMRFVRISDAEAVAIALWVMMTHALDAFDCVPYLAITSAEKRCGKSLLLEVLELVVARPWRTFRGSPAVLLRRIARDCPTLLLDESDAAFKGATEYVETLRGLLNAGYRRPGNQSFCVQRGKTFELVDFTTFCPKAIAGIGNLPDTVADRSIPVRLLRKKAGETVERFRRKFAEAEASALVNELEQWAAAFVGVDRGEPKGLIDLPDRAADIWEPLLMIAESCGLEVAAVARAASVALCGNEREDESLGVRLLADIRVVFTEEKLASAELARRLENIEESPWLGRYARDFDARELAKRLKPFEIRPHTIRLDDGTIKGYYRDDFSDPWARFLPPSKNPSQPSQPSQVACTTLSRK